MDELLTPPLTDADAVLDMIREQALRPLDVYRNLVHDSLKRDKSFVQDLLKLCPTAWDWIYEDMRADVDNVIVAVEYFGLGVLLDVPDALWHDKTACLKLAAFDSSCMHHMSHDMQRDHDVVIACIHGDPYGPTMFPFDVIKDADFFCKALTTIKRTPKFLWMSVDGTESPEAKKLEQRPDIARRFVKANRWSAAWFCGYDHQKNVPKDERFERAGPKQAHFLFRKMQFPFDLPEEVIVNHVLPHYFAS